MVVLRHPPTRASRPVALTIGNFDGVHVGHRAMIERVIMRAGERGIDSCVMTFEPHPREFFAPDQAPARLTTLREKLELLEAFGVRRVLVCRFDQDFARIEAEAFVERLVVGALGARYVLVGDDFRYGARRLGSFDALRAAGKRHGFEVERMHSVEVQGMRVSSTAVRERLAAGELDGAAALLGRPYSIGGRVVGGDRLGRELGFPTANVALRRHPVPLQGIFAVQVTGLGDAPLAGAASLGVRPTVKSGARPVLEVHLLDFEGELYGRRLQVHFLKKLRDEKKYADLASLMEAIGRDVDDTRRYFRERGA
ncbi:MAG: bifunctional riboflavin kinase/FAD synthetase [Burkholderiales bacterium]|nr:bifunctional riboflavin kinase/FAD synthetase [Burkholderiales bacterium]